MTTTQEEQELVFQPQGVVEDLQGRVAGFWIRRRKGVRDTYLFEKPVARVKPYRLEYKTIMVDGEVYHDVPVKVYPEINSLTHWGKYPKRQKGRRGRA